MIEMAEPPLRCPGCGRDLPALQIGGACETCLSKRYLVTVLGREEELMACVGFAGEVETSRGRGHLRHIVLSVDNGLTYCGERATEPKKRRSRMTPEVLPADTCTACIENMKRVQRTAADCRAAKGVS